MYLLIKEGKAEEAKKLMKTNRPYKDGDKVTGELVSLSKLGRKNPEVFEVCGVEKADKKPRQKRGQNKQRENFGPGQDKMLDKPTEKKSTRKKKTEE